jgi:hypothetical protein
MDTDKPNAECSPASSIRVNPRPSVVKPFHLLALMLLAVLPYLPGLRHAFVYDDHGAIIENQFLAEPANLRRVVTLDTVRDPRVLDGQRPVLLLTMFLDRLGADAPQPWRHHATNILWHAVAVLLLFQLVRALGGKDRLAQGLATASALVLALHPAWSEAVQVPSYREDVLGLVFVLAYLRADFIVRPLVRWPVQLLVLALALGAKETAWAAPLLLGWMRLCVPAEGRSRRAVVVAVVIGLLLVAAYVLAGYSGRPVQAAGTRWNGFSLQWPDNLWTAPWIWWRYMALLVVPFPLTADRVVEAIRVPWDPRFIGCCAGLLAVVVAAWRVRRTQPLLAFGLGWLLVAFGPVSNVIPLFNPMADRYLYGLAPGLALLVATLLPRTVWVRRAFPIACVAWLLLLQVRLLDWRDDARLWAATARVEPRSARAQTWLGLLARKSGDREAARQAFTRAMDMNPREVTAPINLAILIGEDGDLAGAEKLLREVIALRPEKYEAWANLAVALELQGRREEALQASEKARAFDLPGRERPPATPGVDQP